MKLRVDKKKKKLNIDLKIIEVEVKVIKKLKGRIILILIKMKGSKNPEVPKNLRVNVSITGIIIFNILKDHTEL